MDYDMIIVFSLIIPLLLAANSRGASFNGSADEDPKTPYPTSMNWNYNGPYAPNNNGKPVIVSVDIRIPELSSISGSSMDIALTLELDQSWNDNMFRLNDSTSPAVVLNKFQQKHAWTPETRLVQTRGSHHHDDDKIITVDGGGRTRLWQRITMTIGCTANPVVFPHDAPECIFMLQSSSYPAEEVTYALAQDPIVTDKDAMDQFRISRVNASSRITERTIGNFSMINISLHLNRNLGYYILVVYIPSVVIILITSLASWIPRSGTPQRITIGMSALVAMAVMLAVVNATIPKMLVFNVLDCYMAACFVFLFVSLLETVFVSQLNRQKTKRKTTHRESAYAPMAYRKVNCCEKFCIFSRLPAIIDRLFRLIYPLLFLVFMIIYFAVLIPHYQSK